MISLHKGFVRNTDIINSAVDWNYEALNGSEMKIIPLPGALPGVKDIGLRCFDLKISGNNAYAEAEISADGEKIIKKRIGPAYTRIELSAFRSITLKNNMGYNMQIGNLGCNR